MTSSAFANRPLPQWYAGAKLGFLIHWGPYSVPAWAERSGIVQDLWANKGPAYFLKHNPYAEWYLNTMMIAGSDTERHHAETYGRDFSYDTFARQFIDASAKADFSTWADLFARAGARYAVLTTKHHDGFLLWPSSRPPPRPGYQPERDLIGGLAEALRARGVRLGLYYSGGYDKLFNPLVIRDLRTAIRAIPQSREYAGYCDAHIAELIERYAPSVLWNDIAYPAASDIDALFARYYAAVPDGVVNERWTQVRLPQRGLRSLLFDTAVRGFNALWPVLPRSMRRLQMRPSTHHDFRTPEYEVYPEATPDKWEATRGLGFSFGNNRTERDEDMISPDELVRLFVDVVSKNGNLLLGIAPDPAGVFPETQRRRLLALGDWLAVNGEAIFDTRPWERAEGTTAGGLPVRFTCTDDAVYAIVLGTPAGPRLDIDGLTPPEGAPARLLGHDAPLAWERAGDGVSIMLPAGLGASPAWALRVGA